jgi:tRNA(Met) cytidine acetyltransferase
MSDNHRHCFILKGSTNEVLSDFLRLCANFSTPLICAYDTSIYDALLSESTLFSTRTFKQVRQELGSTHDAVLVDLTQGVSASALAILTGTVRGNGVFAIALPNEDWLSIPDQDLPRYLPWPYEAEQIDSNFKRYILDHLYSETSPFRLLDQTKVLPSLSPIEENAPLTDEQTKAQSCLLNEEAKSYVLMAPRGRGKSTLLGDTLVKLQQAGKKVAITAPNQAAISTLKFRYEQVSKEVNLTNDLPFFAPDALLAKNSHWDYLFVDEAAMIPVPLLKALTQKAEQCLFSTTDYGYEGAGKGFGIRFCDYLETKSETLIRLTLNNPIRWGENDPLEMWINQLFFLCPPVDEQTLAAPSELSYQSLQGQDWLYNWPLLESSFNLLVNAHYQTSPDNLRWVMDDPSMKTWIAQPSCEPNNTSNDFNSLYAVAIVTQEGSLPSDLSRAVLEGIRRPRGHLVPQSLLAHEGHSNAGDFSYWRVSRIATQTNCRRMSIASQLLDHIEQAARVAGIDFLCASFAATEDTVQFWQKNDFICVRLGTAKDQASGCYSVMVVKPLNTNAQENALTWHQNYLDNLAINLPRDFSDITEALARKLNESHPDVDLCTEKSTVTISEKDREDLLLFAHHHRPYPTIRAQLTRLVKHAIKQTELTSTHPEYALLNAVISQPQDKIDFATFGLKSKKQIERHLKMVTEKLLS